MGANVVSMSWGVTETAIDLSNDHHFLNPNVLFVAAAGDTGTGAQYPAASPYVIGVGTTTLAIDAQGNYLGESADPSSGGGVSCCELAPTNQLSFLESFPDPTVNPQFRRGVPDVAYNGDPASGYAIYDSVAINGSKNWFQIGGSSAATPQWAALLAIVNSSRAEKGKGPLAAGALYNAANSSSNLNYHDITTGSNGSCGALCTAMPGYDYVTGLGSPKADRLIPRLANQ
jgi:subtilase family serine protease